MENIKITLFDNNFTSLNEAEIVFKPEDVEKFRELMRKIGDGLMTEHARHLCIEGVSNSPIDLTITDYSNST